MRLDTPNLLLVQSPKEDDPNVEQLFIEMIRIFIKNYALRETISNQVPAIMVINITVKILLYGGTNLYSDRILENISKNHICIYKCVK